MSSYDEYVEGDFHDQYVDYQERYRAEPRESDKVLMDLVAQAVEAGATSLLDIGCSTGNLLYHLSRRFPDLQLTGGELSSTQLAACRQDPDLAGIRFEALDACNLGLDAAYDIIVSNAVVFIFDEADYRRAIASMHRALAPGGRLLVFDWMHPYPYDLQLVEHSEWHPEGMTIHSRSYGTVRRVLEDVGFTDVAFQHFEIPVDLPNDNAMELHSYTVKAADGRRLLFRGSVFQPWCHLVAVKAG